MKSIWKVLVAIGVILFVGTMFTIILTIAIWPGEAKLLKPWLCSDDQPDAYVVTDTYQSEPGETSTNFTLYCVGPRGDSTDQGWGKPMLILIGVHTLIIVALFFLFGLLAGLAKRRRAVGPPDDTGLQADQPEPVVVTLDESYAESDPISGDDDDLSSGPIIS